MGKVKSCGFAPLRYVNDKFHIMLCKPKGTGFFGCGFLKGQVEDCDSTLLETAEREFAEESGEVDVELINDEVCFIQNNPKKKVFIWPVLWKNTDYNNKKLMDDNLTVQQHLHDDENETIKFHPIDDLPLIFKNQEGIKNEILDYIEKNKSQLKEKLSSV